MSRPSNVEVSGPLEEFAEGFALELVGLGYSPRTIEAQLRLMKHLSEWLAALGLSVGGLTVSVVQRFVVDRRAISSYLRSERALVPLMGFLRGEGAVPLPCVAPPTDPIEVLSGQFTQYLSSQRGLAPETVRSYVSQVQPFLAWCRERHGGHWELLTAAHIAQFTVARAVGLRSRSVQVGLNALRVLLRWMWLESVVPVQLADSIGPIAVRSDSALPKALTGAQVGDLLTGLSVDPLARVRDEAMVAMMWRLAMRAGEVAGLRLEDIDWRAGVLVVHGKGDRSEQVPLPVDVGELVAAYLRRGRPSGSLHRQVFLAVDAPHRPLTASAVSCVVARAGGKVGISGGCGAHRLRHGAACQILAKGGGLIEAGQLLRHSSTTATAVYAKTDIASLAMLVRVWPGEQR